MVSVPHLGCAGGVATYVLVALRATESEEARIVADKGDAFAGIARLRAKVARLNSSYEISVSSLLQLAPKAYLILTVVRGLWRWRAVLACNLNFPTNF